jgi:hypothetical protein
MPLALGQPLLRRGLEFGIARLRTGEEYPVKCGAFVLSLLW